MKVEVVGIWSETINIRILIERSVVIPSETFSSLIPEAEEVVKNPIMAMLEKQCEFCLDKGLQGNDRGRDDQVHQVE